MSADVLFGLYIVAAAVVVLCLLALWGVGRSLRGRNDRRQQLVDPQGRIWATRLHWGQPGAGFGVGRRLFPPTAAADTPVVEEQFTVGDGAGSSQAASAAGRADEPKK